MKEQTPIEEQDKIDMWYEENQSIVNEVYKNHDLHSNIYRVAIYDCLNKLRQKHEEEKKEAVIKAFNTAIENYENNQEQARLYSRELITFPKWKVCNAEAYYKQRIQKQIDITT